MTVFGKQVVFRNIPRCDAVIFEPNGSEIIVKYLLQDVSYQVIDSRLSTLYISVSILYNCLKSFIQKKKEQGVGKKNIIRHLVARLWRCYLLSLILHSRPKIVITLIDNSPLFHWLSVNCEISTFIAIQNGSRTKSQFVSNDTAYSLVHYFCFGLYEKEFFSTMGSNYNIINYYPVGSLMAGIYDRQTKKEIKSIYDLCVISSWRGNIGTSDEVRETMASMQVMDDYISRFISESNIRACVVLRSEIGSSDRDIPIYGDESNYYRHVYGPDVELVDPDFADGNVYKLMNRSELIVSFGSTALREAFGYGKKVLYCDFTDTNMYNDYDPVILFSDNNYRLLVERLNTLLLMPRKEYRDLTKSYAAHVMNYDPDNPPHNVIREVVLNVVSRPSSDSLVDSLI